MKDMDRECRRLCDIQAELFEKSVKCLEMSSEVFVRRFMNSKIALELDNEAFLDDSKTIDDIFIELDKQYGKTTYGTKKYNADAMYWAGYLYRCFSYTYEISSKQAYKVIPLKEAISVYEPYHSLDITHAIERILEAKNISYNKDDLLKKGVQILKRIRNQKDNNPYSRFPVFENDRFIIRHISSRDIDDLLKVYSDKKAQPFFNFDNCHGDDFCYTTLEQIKHALDFWKYSYLKGYFVRWSIYDKSNASIVGTIEQFNRRANDYFDNCSLLRLDLRSDYEEKEVIKEILKMIIPSSFYLFKTNRIVTKAFDGADARKEALKELDFSATNERLIGDDGTKYYGYYELKATC